jgi:hypothetical protein
VAALPAAETVRSRCQAPVAGLTKAQPESSY